MADRVDPRPLPELLRDIPHRLERVPPTLAYAALRDDSREVEAGDIYLAIPGERSDGHAFVQSAGERGAVAHIVQESALATHGQGWSELPLIVVPDTATLRAKLAANHYNWPGRELSLVGITGTNGKTTVTHLLSEIWQQQGLPSGRLGTTDNRIVDQHYPARFTTPFPIEMQYWLDKARQAKAKAVALEVSSHAMSQGRVDELSFRAVALTSFSQDHLDFHPSMQAYLEAKCELAGRLSADGIAVAPVNAGDAKFSAASAFFDRAKGAGAKTLGICVTPHPQAELYCSEWGQDAQGLHAKVHSPWGAFELRSALVGLFNLENLLCASAIALDMGLSPQELERALPQCVGAPGRLERVLVPEPHNYPAVYVDYAHTPDAVARASETLQDQHQGKLITVLGCGGDRDRAKRPVMAAAALAHSDLVVFTSDNPRTEEPEAILDDMVKGLTPGPWTRVCDRGQAIKLAIEKASPQDRVLIAGKGHETYQIIGNTKLPFDDREQAKLALLESRVSKH